MEVHLPSTPDLPERVILAADIGLDRASYEALELAMAQLIEDENHTLAMRLVAMHTLVAGAVAQYGRGNTATAAFSIWIEQMTRSAGRHWLYQEAANWGKGRGGRQRLAMAPIIAVVESHLAELSENTRTQNTILAAAAVCNGKGFLRLPSLPGETNLEQLKHVRLDQDSHELSTLVADRIVSWLRGRVLLRHPSILKGTQYLLVCSALIRWYSAAAAAAKGRDEVGVAEMALAAEIVEREYVWGIVPGSLLAGRRGLTALYSTLLDLLVSPADLAHNPYSGSVST